MRRSGVVNQGFYSVLIAIDDGKSRRGEWHSPGSPEVCRTTIRCWYISAIGEFRSIGIWGWGVETLASRVNAIDPYGISCCCNVPRSIVTLQKRSIGQFPQTQTPFPK